jgi:hypothetical protein
MRTEKSRCRGGVFPPIVNLGAMTAPLPGKQIPYLTSRTRLSEWALKYGAYMHWISATPVW